jgi:hypothetical protein
MACMPWKKSGPMAGGLSGGREAAAVNEVWTVDLKEMTM